MKKYLLACTLLLLSALPAFAQASYVVKDGNGNIQTIHSVNCSSQICPASVPIDINGAPFGVTSNPFFMAFGTGATLPAFAATPTVNVGNINGAPPSLSNPLFVSPATGASFNVVCTSGCAGGGGGGLSVPYGGAIGANGTPVGFKDGSGNLQPLLGDVTNGQWVNVKASVSLPVTGTFFQATQPISAASLPLPTGASTAANQSTGNTSLGNIDTKTPALGQALAASSVPVVLTAAQITTLTPPTSVGISGTLPAFAATPTVNLGTIGTAATAANQTNASQKTQIVDGSGNVIASTTNALNVAIVSGGGSGGTASAFAAVFPAQGTAAGMSQGGNMVAMTGTAGNLNVQCANCSGSGVSTADKASFVAGTSLFAGGGGFFQTTATSNPLTTGQQGLFQLTAQRALFSNLRDSSGNELGVAAAPVQVSLANTAANGTALLVTGTGGTFPVNGTVTANLGTIAGVATQTTLASVLTALGSPFQAGGSIGNTTFAATQASAAALNATVVGTGTFAVQSSPTSAAAWGVNTLASTTAGQSGQLALGAVTTSAPAYTTAQTNALSLTTTGLLRVDGSGVTQPVSLASTTITGTVAVTQSGAWSLSANQSVNVAQVNGVTPLMGNGVTGTGSQRVTIASDNTAFSVNATVTQATSSNLKAQVDPLTPASWGIATATQNSAVATNGRLALAQFNTTPTTITTGNMSPLQLDASGNLKVNIIAGAGSGGTASNFGSAFPTAGTAVGAKDSTGTNMAALNLDASGFLKVNVAAGGAGGGAVFGPTAVGSANANPPVVIGGTLTGAAGQNVAGAAVKAASTQAAATDTSIVVQENPNGPLIAAINAPIPAGTNIVGKFGIDQTTPGTTNLVALAANQSVNLAQVAGASTAVGSGVQATALRTTLATDSPGIVTLGQTTKSASVPTTLASDQGGLPQYPAGAVPLTAAATGTTAATTATLAGTTGKTTYICSLSVRANATANANVTDTVTGVITGTLSRALWVPANTAGLGVDEQIYSPCVPASATNTAIAVVSGAPGTGGVVTVNATGYQL